MSDLWLEFSNDFEMCQRCVGQGTVRSGYGGSEYVMCSSCGGSGSRQKIGRKKSRRRGRAEETDEPAAEEKSEEELWEEMLDRRIEIEGDIERCERYGLPSERAALWSSRLKNIDTTSPEAEAELKDLSMEVKRLSDDYASVAYDEDEEHLVSELSFISGFLDSLSNQSAWYQKRFGRPAAELSHKEEKRTLREEIEALAASSGPESVVACPGCNTKMKARNLRLHFEKKHWWKENGTA